MGEEHRDGGSTVATPHADPLRKHDPMDTRDDGVVFTCPECWKEVELSDLIGGGECGECGKEWAGIGLMEGSDER